MFFRFPPNGRWNDDRQAVEFAVIFGDYDGTVTIPREVFRRFLDGSATPERCVQGYHLQRTWFEMMAEYKVRNRLLTEEGNVEISGRDLLRVPATELDYHPSGTRSDP